MLLQVKDKVNKYFVHYSGWNTKWDEWVPESRMLKVNDANLAKQADLQAAQLKARKESGKRKSSIGGAATRDERRDSATPTGKEKDSAIGRGKDSADKKERPSTTGYSLLELLLLLLNHRFILDNFIDGSFFFFFLSR